MADEILSHWYHGIDGLTGVSSDDFYGRVQTAIENREFPKLEFDRVTHATGAIFAGGREYLRVRSSEFIFDICAAPFGQTFFVSWWLVGRAGCLTRLAAIPVLGWPLRVFITRDTYWRIDTRVMFQSAVHNIVADLVKDLCDEHGRRAPSELERKPVMREFWK